MIVFLVSCDPYLPADLGQTNYTGTLVQYKPGSSMEYRKNKEEWIKLLFKEIDGNEENPFEQRADGMGFILGQNHPNPFAMETTLEYIVSETGNVQIEVSSVFGQVLLRVYKSIQIPGQYKECINLNNFPDGLYFFSLLVNNRDIARVKVIKMH